MNMYKSKKKVLSVLFIGTGGSSGKTIAAIEAQLRSIEPSCQIKFVDTQPFNLRTGGLTDYRGPGNATVLRPADVGLKTPFTSWTLNLLASGGRLAYRRMVAHCLKIIQASGASVVALCHDRIYIETAFIAAAKILGVPTVLIQEGPFCAIGHVKANSISLRIKQLAAPIVNWLGLVPPIPEYGFAGHALIIAASGSYRQRWRDAGLGSETLIKICGIPRYDSLAVLRREAAVPSLPRVLYISQPFAAHGKVDFRVAASLQKILAHGLNQLLKFRSFDLVVRLHPRSSGDDCVVLTENFEGSIVIDDPKASIDQSILSSSIVIGHYSSALLESLILGKPIVCLPVPPVAFAEPSEADKQTWLTRLGVPAAETPESLAHCIAVALEKLSSSYDAAALVDEVGEVDGSSSQRCARAILELIKMPGEA